FNVLEAYKFMISPIGFPFELKVERFFRMAKLGSLLLNQAIIAKKKS
ncbi:MAG: hypothetical protein QG641_1895, partial [Candidatus Poribacteria bacterium]|nr:hypothetical protein [Candidatus Poribacteria bacterium]